MIVAMQLVERPWGVAAYGAASVKAMPDLVRARFRVVRVEQTPSRSFQVASAAVHAVREAIRRHGIPDSAVERSRLDLKSSWNNYGFERYRGHGAGGAASAQDLAPGHVVVSAAVIIGFSITHD